MTILDGGHDAPMGPRDRALFRYLFWAVVLVGLALIVVAALGR